MYYIQTVTDVQCYDEVVCPKCPNIQYMLHSTVMSFVRAAEVYTERKNKTYVIWDAAKVFWGHILNPTGSQPFVILCLFLAIYTPCILMNSSQRFNQMDSKFCSTKLKNYMTINCKARVS